MKHIWKCWKRDQTSRLLRNTLRQVNFHIHRSFEIIHVKCRVRLYLVFVFSKGKYESKYRYMNYFDIQVLMMVTETETLTSTLHHNIFTYLDYIFSADFILSDFNPYIYIYIYIYIFQLSLLNNLTFGFGDSVGLWSFE